MNKTRPGLRAALLASSLALLTNHVWSLRARPANSSETEFLAAFGMDEVCRLASPMPDLLFSHPPSLFITDSSPLEWLTGAEITSLRERLNPDARLIDLTDRVQVIDPIFWELVTTNGLIIDMDQRPKDPVNHPFFLHCSRNPFWTSFWLKKHPVPSTLRPMAFTQELLQEDNKLSWRAVRRFCRSY